MKYLFPTSLRGRLVGLVLAALLPLLALMLYSAAAKRFQAATTTQQHALTIAQLAAAGQVRLIEGARQFLGALAELPLLRNGEPAQVDASLRRLVQQHPFYLNLLVAQTNGAVLSSAVAVDRPTSVADYPCLHEAVRLRQFATGGFRLGKASGRPCLGVAYPLAERSGQDGLVLLASLDLQYLNRELSAVLLPTGASLTVIDPDGLVLARAGGDTELVGQPDPSLPAGQDLLRGRAPVAFQGRGRDGVERFYAAAPVQVSRGMVDAWVTLAIPVAGVYAGANAELQLQLLGLLFVVALALALAWFGIDLVVLRHVRALMLATQQMRDGQLDARANLRGATDELAQLAASFDAMTVALHQRDTERLRAADALRRSHDHLELLVQERAVELSKERDLLRGLVDSLPDYVYVKGADGRYVLDNAAHRNLLGVDSLDQVAGRTVFDFFAPELAEAFHADDRTVLETGIPLFNRAEEVTDKSGRRIAVCTTKVPMRDKDGRVIGLVGVGREVPAVPPAAAT